MQCKLASCCWDAMHSMSCHQRGNFQALYSTAPPQMTVTLSLFSRLDTLPSFSIQTLFYGTQVSALTVLRPAAILAPRCALWCSPNRKALHTFHSITAAWHSHSSCGEKARKHPIAYTKPIAKSCFTFESK